MDPQVLIAGAGPTGLTMALELARRGNSCRVVDQADAFAVGSRADGLQPRTLEVFEDLGVLDDVLASGIGAPLMRVYSGDAVVREERMAEPMAPRPDMPYPNLWFVPQWRTEQILRSRLSDFGVQVQLSTGVVAVTQDAAAVTVQLDSGETTRADYLIGADGGASTVRRQLAVPFIGETDDTLRMLLADVRVDGLDHETGHVWLADGQFFAVIPLAGGPNTYTIATMAPSVQPNLEDLQRAVDVLSGRADLRLHDLTWSTVWRPNVRMAKHFRVGRVFLAGDAAHVHPPTGAQGLNTSIQDAYNLGWKLATALAGGPSELLESYEIERLPVAARVLGISSELLGKHVRATADAMQRGEETQQLDLTYRGGPLALDDGSAGGVRAGDRAPDAPYVDCEGTGGRLFTLFIGPHWTLLRFGPQAPRINHPDIKSYEIGADVVDSGRHIKQAYQVNPAAAVLVRPDGYVGAISRDPVALGAYANRVLSPPMEPHQIKSD